MHRIGMRVRIFDGRIGTIIGVADDPSTLEAVLRRRAHGWPWRGRYFHYGPYVVACERGEIDGFRHDDLTPLPAEGVAVKEAR